MSPPTVHLAPKPKTFDDLVVVIERHDSRISTLVASEASTSAALGQVAAELAKLRRSDDELRQVIVEQSAAGSHRSALDTGSFSLVEAWRGVQSAAADPQNPMTTERARALFAEEIARMKVAADSSAYRRWKAVLPKLGMEAVKALVTLSVGGGVVELLHLFGK